MRTKNYKFELVFLLGVAAFVYMISIYGWGETKEDINYIAIVAMCGTAVGGSQPIAARYHKNIFKLMNEKILKIIAMIALVFAATPHWYDQINPGQLSIQVRVLISAIFAIIALTVYFSFKQRHLESLEIKK